MVTFDDVADTRASSALEATTTSDANETRRTDGEIERGDDGDVIEPFGEKVRRFARVSRAAVAHHPRVRALGRLVTRKTLDDLPPDASLVMFGVTHWDRETSSGERSNEVGRREWERDWRSRCWMTYRRGFEALGRTKWCTDAGWGCTLRSAQMMLANALSIHSRGRHWRREVQLVAVHENETADDGSKSPAVSFLSGVVNKLKIPQSERTRAGSDAQEDILRLFADEVGAPFSIHRVCEKTTEWGAPPGRWFEPSVMCRAFEALVAEHDLGSELTVHVVSGREGEDGGVPTVDEVEVRAKSADVGKALLLFVPVVLGVGRTINARYLSQLRSMMAFKQSVGIVGGRPNSSLYLVGHSDDVFFCLDPHTVQVASSMVTMDFESYYCPTPLHVCGGDLDPTLALGFYCRDGDDVASLLVDIEALARVNATAPALAIRPADNIYKSISPRHAERASPSVPPTDIRDDEFADWTFV